MQFTETEAAYSFRNLSAPGRIRVSAMRSAPAGAATTMSCFVNAFGEKRGRPCFVLFLQIVHALTLFGRRRMRVGSVGWPMLTHDEVAFLRCVDAAVRGDEPGFGMRIAWLVRRRGAAEFAGYMWTLAGLVDEPLLGDAASAESSPQRDRATVRQMKKPTQNWSASASPVAVE